MKLSDKLKADHESGDCGKALEGYSEEAKSLEDLVSAQKVLVYLCINLTNCTESLGPYMITKIKKRSLPYYRKYNR